MTKSQITFKSLVSIHLIVLILTTLTIGMVYTIRKNQPISADESLLLFEFIVPLVAISSFVVSHFISKKKLSSLSKQASLNEKLTLLKEVKTMQWVSLFGSVILASIGFLISARQNLLLYAMMIGVMILYYRPVKGSIGEDLDLTTEELDSLSSPKENT